MDVTAGELAERVGATCIGDATVRITGVAGLREARPGDISFLGQPRYASYMIGTGASAVVVGLDFDQPFDGALIPVACPEEVFQRIATWFSAPAPDLPAGVHPTAVVASDVELAGDVGVGAHVVIEAGARIGRGCRIHAGCYVGHGVRLGEDCVLRPLVSIQHHCILGHRVWVHNGAVIGSDGFGYTVDEQGIRTKIPQIGIVEIGDDVELGANVTVDRARFGRTRIGDGVKVDNLVHVAHNVMVGDHVVLIAQVGIAGSCIIGEGAILGGQVGVGGHLVIGDHAVISAQSGVTKDVPAGAKRIGFPAAPHAKAAKAHANVNRIPQLKQRVAELEQRIQDLER